MDIIEHTRKVKTRKKHQCFACLGLFPKGAEMMVQVNNYDGQIGRVYSCLTCDEIMDKHKDVCYDEVDHVFREGCVREIPQWWFEMDEREECNDGKNPEKVLEILNRQPVRA